MTNRTGELAHRTEFTDIERGVPKRFSHLWKEREYLL